MGVVATSESKRMGQREGFIERHYPRPSSTSARPHQCPSQLLRVHRRTDVGLVVRSPRPKVGPAVVLHGLCLGSRAHRSSLGCWALQSGWEWMGSSYEVCKKCKTATALALKWYKRPEWHRILGIKCFGQQSYQQRERHELQ